MRFSLEELLQGVLASISVNRFPDDAARLASGLHDLVDGSAFFGPMSAVLTSDGVEGALAKLVTLKVLQRTGGECLLSDDGRAHCVSMKRTLFGARDQRELETAAQMVSALA